jgi:DNA repair protein RadA/Sms
MAKTIYTCRECGGTSPKWLGQCPHCRAWNTLDEARPNRWRHKNNRFQSLAAASRWPRWRDRRRRGAAHAHRPGRTGPRAGRRHRRRRGGADRRRPRHRQEHAAAAGVDALSAQMPVLYVTGEESGAQIALRSRRLGLAGAKCACWPRSTWRRSSPRSKAEDAGLLRHRLDPDVYSDQLTSAPGSVAQVRECAAQLTRVAKTRGCTVVLVGHVTKEGALAGPRVLEHIVDTVLYFEGDTHSSFPPGARHQEPLRRRQRDRRLRHDRKGPEGCQQPQRHLPVHAQRAGARQPACW